MLNSNNVTREIQFKDTFIYRVIYETMVVFKSNEAASLLAERFNIIG